MNRTKSRTNRTPTDTNCPQSPTPYYNTIRRSSLHAKNNQPAARMSELSLSRTRDCHDPTECLVPTLQSRIPASLQHKCQSDSSHLDDCDGSGHDCDGSGHSSSKGQCLCLNMGVCADQESATLSSFGIHLTTNSSSSEVYSDLCKSTGNNTRAGGGGQSSSMFGLGAIGTAPIWTRDRPFSYRHSQDNHADHHSQCSHESDECPYNHYSPSISSYKHNQPKPSVSLQRLAGLVLTTPGHSSLCTSDKASSPLSSPSSNRSNSITNNSRMDLNLQSDCRPNQRCHLLNGVEGDQNNTILGRDLALNRSRNMRMATDSSGEILPSTPMQHPAASPLPVVVVMDVAKPGETRVWRTTRSRCGLSATPTNTGCSGSSSSNLYKGANNNQTLATPNLFSKLNQAASINAHTLHSNDTYMRTAVEEYTKSSPIPNRQNHHPLSRFSPYAKASTTHAPLRSSATLSLSTSLPQITPINTASTKLLSYPYPAEMTKLAILSELCSQVLAGISLVSKQDVQKSHTLVAQYGAPPNPYLALSANESLNGSPTMGSSSIPHSRHVHNNPFDIFFTPEAHL
ncbi:hypothetical protein BSLG_002110 [Batrachochytrium salamandrivorans]|nr:hypothetical protein BSLG_002110 [Batrachochytrium salamandrivorans]